MFAILSENCLIFYNTSEMFALKASYLTTLRAMNTFSINSDGMQ